jgi:hypothetical protein
MQQPHTILADGTPMEMFENTEETNPRGDALLGRTKTYDGRFHGNAAFNDAHTVPKRDYRLVVFHYVTRSQQQFVDLKLTRSTGKYAKAYRRQASKSPQGLYSPAIMARFEHGMGFDGEQPVCSSAVDAGYVERCCGNAPFVKELLQRKLTA